MPTTANPSSEQITSILLEASSLLTGQGAKSKAFRDFQAKTANMPAFVQDLINSKVDRVAPGWGTVIAEKFSNIVNSPGWRQRSWQTIKAFFTLPGIRHVLDFFRKDYPITWKLIVALLAAVVGWTQLSPGSKQAPDLPVYWEATRDQTYFTSRLSGMHILRAPEGVKIDADLSEWRTDGWFKTACFAPWDKQYFLEGAMMYDDDALYVAAKVGDPFPMRNAIEVSQDSEPGVYQGGSLQVLLALRAVKDNEEFKNQNDDPQLVRMTLWYSRPEPKADGTAYLIVRKTLNQDGKFTLTKDAKDAQDTKNFQGKFKPLSGGTTGYQLEYRIPWGLLTADGKNPFRDGIDASRTSWELHWSDETGKKFRGKITEVVNPLDKRFAYLNAAVWGIAFVHPPGK